MAYSMDPSTDLCYEGTACLINKFSIKDPQKLSELEAQITFAKAVMLDAEPIEGKFDFHHYKQIHQFLFCDLYDWAGQIRTTDISKKRTNFLRAQDISDVATRCFAKVEQGFLDNLSFDAFASRVAELYHDINYIHPFREGNGRTQRIYFTQLIRAYGYDINFSEVDTDLLMIATIQAAGGVMDLLTAFFKESITHP